MCTKPGLKAQSLNPNGRKSGLNLPSFTGKTLRRFVVTINVKKKRKEGRERGREKGRKEGRREGGVWSEVT